MKVISIPLISLVAIGLIGLNNAAGQYATQPSRGIDITGSQSSTAFKTGRPFAAIIERLEALEAQLGLGFTPGVVIEPPRAVELCVPEVWSRVPETPGRGLSIVGGTHVAANEACCAALPVLTDEVCTKICADESTKRGVACPRGTASNSPCSTIVHDDHEITVEGETVTVHVVRCRKSIVCLCDP